MPALRSTERCWLMFGTWQPTSRDRALTDRSPAARRSSTHRRLASAKALATAALRSRSSSGATTASIGTHSLTGCAITQVVGTDQRDRLGVTRHAQDAAHEHSAHLPLVQRRDRLPGGRDGGRARVLGLRDPDGVRARPGHDLRPALRAARRLKCVAPVTALPAWAGAHDE